MENIFTETTKMVATNFATWMENNDWTAVWSDELKIRAYVDASKNNVLVNGSDYTKLIKENSKNLGELYELFILDERRRLEIETIKMVEIMKDEQNSNGIIVATGIKDQGKPPSGIAVAGELPG